MGFRRQPFKYRCLLLISPIILVLDQLTKWWVLENIVYGHGIAVIPGFFDLVHVRNTGAAFGLFANANSVWREPFFYLISAVALAVIYSVVRSLQSNERLLAVVLSLVLGGVLGNLVDRIRFGYVIDFLSVHWRHQVVEWGLWGHHWSLPLEWPAFNIADSAITVSMILLAAYFIRTPNFSTQVPGNKGKTP